MEGMSADFYNMSDDPLGEIEMLEAGGKMRRRLLAVASSLLIAVGCICNVLCVAVFARRQMRVVPTYYGLLLLSIADALMLVYGLGHDWLHLTFDIDLPSTSHVYCVFFNVAFSVLSDLASMLVVGVAVCHCCCACCCPKASSIRSRETGVGAAFCRFPIIYVWTAFYVVLCTLSNIYIAWFVEMDEWSKDHVVCFHHFDIIKLFFKPVLLQFLLLCLLPYLIYLAYCPRNRINSNGNRRGQRARYHSSFPAPPDSSEASVSVEDEGEQQEAGSDDEGVVASRLDVTILALCVAYLVTNLPITVVNFLSVLFYHHHTIISTVTWLLWYFNFAFKITIYLLTAPDFRRILKRLIINGTPRSESREAIAMLES